VQKPRSVNRDDACLGDQAVFDAQHAEGAVWLMAPIGGGCELFGGLCVFVIERMFYWVGEAG
jgi:hypothetical protein